MTQFLKTQDKPDGYKLEEILAVVRKDILVRATKILNDDRIQAQEVLDNDIKIMSLLSDAIQIAHESTRILDRAFGPHRDGKPRIGVL